MTPAAIRQAFTDSRRRRDFAARLAYARYLDATLADRSLPSSVVLAVDPSWSTPNTNPAAPSQPVEAV